MDAPLLNRLVQVKQGAYLPHWTAANATYHTVFRLSDSLPIQVMARYRAEALASISPADRVDAAELVDAALSKKVEAHLDRSASGSCWMRRPEFARVVAATLLHFNGQRYTLHAWCVMPNHVHSVFTPFGSYSLSSILHSWKSYSSTSANRILSRTGAFWQKESYDHIIRSDEELQRTVVYVENNPISAELMDWPWVSRGAALID